MKKAGFVVVCLLLCVLAASSFAEGLPQLSYGSVGDAVYALQERLTELGYYSFRITGKFQENTQKAVRDFQHDNGFAVTGVADDALQRLILSTAAQPRPTPTPIPTMPPEELAAEYPGERLQYGNGGQNVRRIQTRLQQLGYYTDRISGDFLKNTRAAVKAFQQQNALEDDGVVGAATWQALFFDEQAVEANATPRPTPEPTPVPYRIGVDVTNQITTIYGLDEDGGYTDALKLMLCSTGTSSDPTPVGIYTLNGRTARWCYFSKWGTHAQYWTRIDAYNAFHSVIYSQPDPMALKTGSYTGLGKKASHGCIRLMIEDAKWIYLNCGAGVEVEVYEGILDEELTKSLKIPPLDYSVMLPVATPGPTQSPVYQPDTLPPLPLQTLKRGSEGEDVYWLQCKLAELGYYAGSITGGYYAGTTEAVKAFQRDNGLSVDGKAGKKTLSVLYADVLATPSPSPDATPWVPPAESAQVAETLSPYSILITAPGATATPASEATQTVTPGNG